MKLLWIYKTLVCTALVLSTSVATAQYVSERDQREQEKAEKNKKFVEALEALRGKMFWYVPNPKAIRRVKFIEPDESGDLPKRHRHTTFVVTAEASFVVSSYLYQDYDYYLQVTFPDGKIGYLTVNPIASNAPDKYPIIDQMYPTDGRAVFDFEEFIYSKPPQEVFAANRKALADEAAKVAKAAAAWKARGGVRIGMTAEQVRKSNWGKPNKVNRTTSPNGLREQWVYDGSNYLYFENGVLITIQN